MLTWLHGQIPVTQQPCSLLTKKQEYAINICTVRVHDFFAPKLDWNLTNLGRMCWIPEKTDWKNAWALLLSLLLNAPTSPDRIWEWPWSTAMCMAMQMFGLFSLKRWLPMDHRELPELLRGDIARKKTTRPAIHTASYYSKFSNTLVERQISSDRKQSSCWNTWL